MAALAQGWVTAGSAGICPAGPRSRHWEDWAEGWDEISQMQTVLPASRGFEDLEEIPGSTNRGVGRSRDGKEVGRV